MLPMISARGNGNMSAHAGGQDTARSRGGDANKFNKLKGVLVNNLLKYYHKETKRQGNEQVYARAVEEVERILQHGKLQEKHLKELQQRFASGLGISEGKVGQTSKGALTMHSNMGPAQIISDDGAIERHNAAGGTAEEDASTMDGMSTANGSPSKRQVFVCVCARASLVLVRVEVTEQLTWAVMSRNVYIIYIYVGSARWTSGRS